MIHHHLSKHLSGQNMSQNRDILKKIIFYMIHQHLSNTFQNMYSHPQIFPFFSYSGFHTIAFTLLTAPSVVPKSKRCHKISLQYNHTQNNYIQYNHVQYNHTQYNNIPIAYIIGNINCQKRHLSQFALHALSVFWTF